MAIKNPKQVTFDERYVEELLLDESNLAYRDYAAGLELLRKYANIPEDQIAAHVSLIQHRAYRLAPYPCIGLLRFLICSLSEHTLYPSILARLHPPHNATYLDLGCCFAQDIRKLAFDGAPVRECVGVDLEPGFFELAGELFRDGEVGRVEGARFLGGDVFDEDAEVWAGLRESRDVVHASSFFHLFGLAKQRVIARRIAGLVRPVAGSVVLGLQLAGRGGEGEEGEEIAIVSEEEKTFCHSVGSMRELWEGAGREAGLEGEGLRWEVVQREREVPEQMRIGLLSDPRLREVFWVAELVKAD